MTFNSTTFIVFFLFVFSIYWGISRFAGPRLWFLFVMSCIFYASWSVPFFPLLLFTIVVDFCIGLALGRTENPTRRKLLLAVSLLGNVGMLGFFKYFNFFAENVAAGLGKLGLGGTAGFVPWNIVLPIGISFYTFQSLSYTIDVYRRELEPKHSLLKFCAFVTFFPHLVAGPIVRASEFLWQLDLQPVYDDQRVQRGIFLMATGLIKKVALADTIGAELVTKVFAHPEQFHPAEVVLGVYGALFQFYLDFSAYSDIAIGAAACLGLTLPQNFDRPFLAQTFGEFWRRWHMTLSRLLRDYLFFPLGGTRGGLLFRFRNFMTTFLLAGLWHGAGWNFVLWGALHGVCSFASSEWGKLRGERSDPPLWARFLRRTWVFNLVALSMLFFRNGTVDTGNLGIRGSLNMLRSLAHVDQAWSGTLSFGLVLLSIAALIHFTPKEWVAGTSDRWVRLPSPVQASILVLLTGSLAAVSYLESPFIYFQF